MKRHEVDENVEVRLDQAPTSHSRTRTRQTMKSDTPLPTSSTKYAMFALSSSVFKYFYYLYYFYYFSYFFYFILYYYFYTIFTIFTIFLLYTILLLLYYFYYFSYFFYFILYYYFYTIFTSFLIFFTFFQICWSVPQEQTRRGCCPSGPVTEFAASSGGGCRCHPVSSFRRQQTKVVQLEVSRHFAANQTSNNMNPFILFTNF